MKDSVESLSADGLLVMKLVAELGDERSRLFM